MRMRHVAVPWVVSVILIQFSQNWNCFSFKCSSLSMCSSNVFKFSSLSFHSGILPNNWALIASVLQFTCTIFCSHPWRSGWLMYLCIQSTLALWYLDQLVNVALMHFWYLPVFLYEAAFYKIIKRLRSSLDHIWKYDLTADPHPLNITT